MAYAGLTTTRLQECKDDGFTEEQISKLNDRVSLPFFLPTGRGSGSIGDREYFCIATLPSCQFLFSSAF